MFKEDTSSKYLKIIFFTLVLAALVMGNVPAWGVRTVWANDLYFNSSEPGCDGSNPNYVMCDDFEDGTWYEVNADVARSTGGFLQTDGWHGTIYAEPITPAGAAECGSKGAARTNCAATNGTQPGSTTATLTLAGVTTMTLVDASTLPTSDSSSGWMIGNNRFTWTGKIGNQLTGVSGVTATFAAGTKVSAEGNRNMAAHNFAPNETGYDEVYIRYYFRVENDHLFGGQKHMTINLPGGSGIKWGDLGFNVGGGAGGTVTGQPIQCFGTVTQVWGKGCANVAQGTATGCNFCLGLGGGGIDPPLEISPGKWFAMQLHLKLNTLKGTRNGIYEFWMDDCGANGLGCTAAPTKRFSRSDIDYDRLSSSELIGQAWQENWANPGTIGTEYYDQYIISKTGPIPWMSGSPPPSVTAPPSAPSGLTVR